MRMQLGLVVLFLTGCDPAREPPLSPDLDRNPVEVDGREADVPRSIHRLIAAEHLQLSDMENLVAIVGDERGRTRIVNELDSQRSELDSIERTLERADSEGLDDIVRRIRRLRTRTDLLHESLLTAAR